MKEEKIYEKEMLEVKKRRMYKSRKAEAGQITPNSFTV